MARNDLSSLQSQKIKVSMLVSILIVQSCIIFFTGCYTALTRHFILEEPDQGRIYEWYFSVTLSSFFKRDKKDFEKYYGTSAEDDYDYGFGVDFWTITEIDTSLSDEERHEVKVDSVKISFNNFSKTFLVDNCFKDNKRKKKFGRVPLDYFYANTYINLGSIYIPPGTQKVEVTIYGMLRSRKDGLETFELPIRLKYEEKSEKISKYD